jgi:hypothetical protein
MGGDKALAVRLGPKRGGTNIRNPNLNRTKALRAKPGTVFANLLA